jgi:membrane-bound lytic murein transglycosylase D
MFKTLFLLLIHFTLLADLSYSTNYNKELKTLHAFDIQPSFLSDPIMNKMRNQNSTYAQDKNFFDAMDTAHVFMPAIKNALSQYDIPQEFLYLAMTESGFQMPAEIRRKTAGLWQFMPETGRNFNLRIDEYVDERRDMLKSTKAAAEYLSSLYKHFGKWYLAAIAYNCGEGYLKRAIKKAGSDNLNVLLNPEKKYIPKASRLHIRKIVALALIGGDEQFLLAGEYEYLLNRANAYTIATVKLSNGESLSRVANILDMPLEELKKLNRHLKYDFIPPYAKEYDVYIPYVKLSEFKQKYYEEPMRNIYKIHVVAKGENLSHISKKYGVSHKIIKDFNKLKNNVLSLNQKLIIPISKTLQS